MSDYTLLLRELAGRPSRDVTSRTLIADADVKKFLRVASERLAQADANEVLLRAIRFRLDSEPCSLEISFISLYAALESLLTFFRRQGQFEILSDEEFGNLERELRKWLRQQPALAAAPVKRGLIYEKIRELNRFSFSFVFGKFCEHYSIDLSDLWPLIGAHADWPLLEIRHRLIHGDPFEQRPEEALACARAHLTWTVDRMLLCVLGWPVERSNVRSDYLQRTSDEYQSWPAERARFRLNDVRKS